MSAREVVVSVSVLILTRGEDASALMVVVVVVRLRFRVRALGGGDGETFDLMASSMSEPKVRSEASSPSPSSLEEVEDSRYAKRESDERVERRSAGSECGMLLLKSFAVSWERREDRIFGAIGFSSTSFRRCFWISEFLVSPDEGGWFRCDRDVGLPAVVSRAYWRAEMGRF